MSDVTTPTDTRRLSPLEGELITEMRRGNEALVGQVVLLRTEQREDFAAMRAVLDKRLVALDEDLSVDQRAVRRINYAAIGGLVVFALFALAMLGQTRGADPEAAATAVHALVPEAP